MRTNIDVDDHLMADALKASGCKTKKEAVFEIGGVAGGEEGNS